MKGRKHDLNYPFDPDAVSDPACWLPLEFRGHLSRRIGMLRHAPRLPPEPPVGVLDVSGDYPDETGAGKSGEGKADDAQSSVDKR